MSMRYSLKNVKFLNTETHRCLEITAKNFGMTKISEFLFVSSVKRKPHFGQKSCNCRQIVVYQINWKVVEK